MDNNVQSIVKIFKVLELLSGYSKGLQLRNISEELGWNKSTVHRLLNTLVGMGYVSKTEEGAYYVNLKILNLVKNRMIEMDIVKMSKELLKNLSEEIQETVHLVRLKDFQVVYMEKVVPTNSQYSMLSYVGKVAPLYCTGVGKVMLAYRYAHCLKEVWKTQEITKLTENTIVDINDMKKEIWDIQERGYALDDEENEMGIYCMAVPVFNYLGEVEYSISVSVLKKKITPDKEKEIVEKIKEVSKKISQNIGYSM